MSANTSDSPPSIPEGWLDRHKAAAIFGVKVRQFDAKYREMCPAAGVQEIDGVLYFHVSLIIEALLEEERSNHRGGGSGFDSEAAARIQRAKAEQEEYKAAVMRDRLVDKDKFKTALMGLTPILRRGIETLGRLFGQGAADIMNGCVDEWVEGLQRYFNEK